MVFDIVEFLMSPAEILTQGMVGLILGLGLFHHKSLSPNSHSAFTRDGTANEGV